MTMVEKEHKHMQIPWWLVLKQLSKWIAVVGPIVVAFGASGKWVVDQVVSFEESQHQTTSSIQSLGTVISLGLQNQDKARDAAITGLKQELEVRRNQFNPRFDKIEKAEQTDQNDIAGLKASIEDVKTSVDKIDGIVRSIDSRTVTIDNRTESHSKDISDTAKAVRSIVINRGSENSTR